MENDNIKTWIYHYEMHYKRHLQLLDKESAILPENKEAIKEFLEHCIASGNEISTAVIAIQHLRRVARLAKKPFKDFNEKDRDQLLAALESATGGRKSKKKFSSMNKSKCKSLLKRMMRDTLKLPNEIWQGIKVDRKANGSRQLLPEHLLTEDEMNAMAAATSSPMYRAMLSVLFECGLRPGELLSIHIGDVKLAKEEKKVKLYVAGKMEKKQGKRAVYIYRGLTTIKQWIAIHPQKANPEAPLWLNGNNQPIRVDTFTNEYKRLSSKARIAKHNFPYLARHTRLTQFYRDFGAVIGAKLAGHTPGSQEIRTYLHLSEADVENVLDVANGVKESKKKVDEQKCPSCDKVNPYGEITCIACGSALNSAGAVVVEAEKQQELQQLKELKELLVDPQIMDFLKDLKKPKQNVEAGN